MIASEIKVDSSPSTPIRTVAAYITYLIYAAVAVRVAAFFQQNPPVQSEVVVLLAVYGLVLFTEPLLTRRLPRYPYVYLIVQSVLVYGLLLAVPQMDFLPLLFFPLSFQAVQFFKRRLGFLWIGAFSLAAAVLLMQGWEWQLQGLAQVLLFAGSNFLVGIYADYIQVSDAARQESQRLLAELQQTYHQLEAYAAQQEEYAAAQERSRLARELHDSVTQTLFSMNLTVEAARMVAGFDVRRVSEYLDRLQELARSAVTEIQLLVSHLRPRPLVEGGLPAALRRLAADRERRDGLQVSLELLGERDLPEPVAIGLYRIVQEALNNVAKHSGARQATVRLDLERRPACLEVEDRGSGFDPRQVERSVDHLGLAGMAERAHELGWELQVDAQPGRGTRLQVVEGEYGRG